MFKGFSMPPAGFGPGSQPPEPDGSDLAYMAMPQDMRTYAPHLPEVGDAAALGPALTLLETLSAAAARVAKGGAPEVFDLGGLDAPNRRLVAETLGEGEVSMKIAGQPAVAVQEAVFAGVWGLRGAGIDRIEVAPMPQAALARAFVSRRPGLGALAPKGPGVVNAPPILVELFDRSRSHRPGAGPHVVNLSLLPHTEADLAWLDAALGEGSVTVLSRGYGNCRIAATGTPQVWRVRFFNSMDALILDTFEVTEVPEVALAAAEDLADSARRLAEVLEAVR
jgi:hydrogenase-1 operon protein HyaF